MLKKISIISIIICSIIGFSACQKENSIFNTKVTFNDFNISDTEDGKTYQDIKYMQVYVENNDNLKKTVDKINERIKTNAYKFKDENAEEVREMAKENPDAMYEYDSSLVEDYFDTKYIVVTENTYEFRMGAHGGTTILCHNLVYDTGVELKLLSILKDKKTFRDALIKKLYDVKNDYDLMDDFENTIDDYLNNKDGMELQFSIGEDYVGITFQQYDIAPYSSGIITINMDKSYFNL